VMVETHSTVWTILADAVTTAWPPDGTVVTKWPSTYASRGAKLSDKFTRSKSPVWLYSHSATTGATGLPLHAGSSTVKSAKETSLSVGARTTVAVRDSGAAGDMPAFDVRSDWSFKGLRRAVSP